MWTEDKSVHFENMRPYSWERFKHKFVDSDGNESDDDERFRVADTADIAVVRKLEDESEGEDERSRRRREGQHADRRERDARDRPLDGGHIDVTA